MAEHDDQDMGYFLPEDSQRLLTQIKNHIHFLAQLARPRVAGETREQAPEVGMAELMFCLDQLAEQLELVLKDVSWLVRPEASDEAADERPPATADKDDATGEEGEEAVEAGHATDVGKGRFLFGVTLDQIDKLHLLVSGIKAYGDAVYADSAADFAAGTLSMLGHTIFDRAIDLDEILAEITVQRLSQDLHRGRGIEESAPAYGVVGHQLQSGNTGSLREIPSSYTALSTPPRAINLH